MCNFKTMQGLKMQFYKLSMLWMDRLWTDMQFLQYAELKMQFNKLNMHWNSYCALERTYMQKWENRRKNMQCNKQNKKINPKFYSAVD